ncbi:hypothetical protein [Rhodanobacter sp. L36]|uniref:hypothetical protein n=1 Tax=Rhodanobacter sp. L36 TaxID=1747221 RepID=UPI00131CEA4B|nr:hypothetical protein [Rhodanobacter sp. L36]
MNIRTIGMAFFLLCLPTILASRDASRVDAVDIAVLKVVLNAQRHMSDDGFLVLSSTTEAPGPNADIGAADNSGAVGDLKRRAQIPTALPESLATGDVHLLNDREIQQALKDARPTSTKASSIHKGWESFYSAFPGSAGLLKISLPGYAATGDIAVVYTSFRCGRLCGTGQYFYLRKVGGTWQILVYLPVWVS